MKIIYGVIVVLVAVAACSKIATPPLKKAVVWGQVTIDTGGPASRAAMFAEATPTGVACVQGTLVSWGRADSLGRYRLTVFGAGVGDSGCVFVGALFPPQGTNGRDTVLGPYRLRFLDSIPFDSTHVDIVLPH